MMSLRPLATLSGWNRSFFEGNEKEKGTISAYLCISAGFVVFVYIGINLPKYQDKKKSKEGRRIPIVKAKKYFTSNNFVNYLPVYSLNRCKKMHSTVIFSFAL